MTREEVLTALRFWMAGDGHPQCGPVCPHSTVRHAAVVAAVADLYKELEGLKEEKRLAMGGLDDTWGPS